MMKPLRIIYIVWLVFGTILSLYGFFYMIFSDKSFLESFSLAILILLIFSILPLLPYFYYLIYDKARKIKNLFVAICCYLLLLIITRDIVIYSIGVVIHIITFIIIYMDKKDETSNQ
ncbi:hypothetical protein CHLV4139_08770 [Campylobacter helveticus]|uniref:hypothetical protein n=1 Tax=Campylobacter helveticus TaxID=28898 RepID=UPI00214C5E83|nr:hypothetical protein [Campylobacter helveticus]MCR2055574.1 hypothetical protein [Campylobacter helveticus]